MSNQISVLSFHCGHIPIISGLSDAMQDYVIAKSYVDIYQQSLEAYRNADISADRLYMDRQDVLEMLNDNCPSIRWMVINDEIILTW